MTKGQAMLQEVQTILGRAAANRQRLNELIEVLDDEHWLRRHSNDVWDVRGHLQHLASIEPLITHTLREAVELGSAWICGSPTVAGLQEAREAARLAVSDLGRKELLAEIALTRTATIVALTELAASALEAMIRFPPQSEWSPPAGMPIRQYLREWAAHDLAHEQAIRDAITIQPGAANLAVSLRMRAKKSRP